MDLDFSEAEIQRYARHILLREVGGTGQAKLKAASVLIVGAGGLGSPLALYLAAAGIGRIGIVDPDVLELSNLQRQIAHGTEQIGQLKVHSAAAAMRRINPLVNVEGYAQRLDAANVQSLIAGYDVICDGTDNFETRFPPHFGFRCRPALRRPARHLQAACGRRPLLPLPVPGAAAGRPGAKL